MGTDLGSRYFGPLANISKEVLLVMLRSPVITWSAGLCMNGELQQVQSGGLDLKSSMLRSYNTFLSLNIFVVIWVYEIIGAN